jgi:hypothetical protein
MLGGSISVLLKVVNELTSEFLGGQVEHTLVLPGVDWVENLGINVLACFRHVETKAGNDIVLLLFERAVVDVVDNLPCVLEGHSMANSVFATSPSGVYEPDVGIILLDLLGKHLGVEVRMFGEESFSKAGREC